MDIIGQLGPLAFASRLRRLSERLMRDASRVYKSQQINMEARWFPIMYLLRQEGAMGITEIARALQVTHPAVNQLAAGMLEEGLLVESKDPTDERRRILALSRKAQNALAGVEPIWEAIEEATREVIDLSGDDLLGSLKKFETALDEREMYDRVLDRLHERDLSPVEIIEYDPRYRQAFRDLNVEWLEKYFTVEPIDATVLDNPDETVLKPGGQILFARIGETIVGTTALLKKDPDTFELAKMGVTERWQGWGLGRRLAEAAIEYARQQNAQRIILYTAKKLKPAIELYRQLGFTEVELEKPPEYERCTFTMELDLRNSS